MRWIWYELKRSKVMICVIAACLVLIQGSVMMTSSNGFGILSDGNSGITDSGVTSAASWLCVLCFCVPPYVFRFRTRSREVDLYYSLPLSRFQLFISRAVLGLILVLVPFTIMYWSGFMLVLLSPQLYFNMLYYVPLYFLLVLMGVLLFGILSFAYTRANTLGDGIVFMGAYALVGMLVYLATALKISEINSFNQTNMLPYTLFFVPQTIITQTANYFDLLIVGQQRYDSSYVVKSVIELFAGEVSQYMWLGYVVIGVAGALAWLGMLLLLGREQPEKAGHLSNSFFGYRVLLPLFLGAQAILFGIVIRSVPQLIIYSVMSLSITWLIGYVIFRRSLEFKKEDLSGMAAAFIGLLIGIL